jgi:hypothetical protein
MKDRKLLSVSGKGIFLALLFLLISAIAMVLIGATVMQPLKSLVTTNQLNGASHYVTALGLCLIAVGFVSQVRSTWVRKTCEK